MVSGAYECLLDFISDHTPIVLKSVCEALRICLPVLLVSTQPTKGMGITLVVASKATLSLLYMYYTIAFCCEH